MVFTLKPQECCYFQQMKNMEVFCMCVPWRKGELLCGFPAGNRGANDGFTKIGSCLTFISFSEEYGMPYCAYIKNLGEPVGSRQIPSLLRWIIVEFPYRHPIAVKILNLVYGGSNCREVFLDLNEALFFLVKNQYTHFAISIILPLGPQVSKRGRLHHVFHKQRHPKYEQLKHCIIKTKTNHVVMLQMLTTTSHFLRAFWILV